MTVEELCAVARSLPGYEDLGRGATPSEISSLEKRLGVTLPDSYRTFIERCGYAAWEGGQIGGIKTAPTDAVWVGEAGINGRCLLFCKGSLRCGQVTCLEDVYEYGSEVEYWRTFEDFFEYRLVGTENSIVVADWSKYVG